MNGEARTRHYRQGATACTGVRQSLLLRPRPGRVTLPTGGALAATSYLSHFIFAEPQGGRLAGRRKKTSKILTGIWSPPQRLYVRPSFRVSNEEGLRRCRLAGKEPQRGESFWRETRSAIEIRGASGRTEFPPRKHQRRPILMANCEQGQGWPESDA